MPLTSHNKTPNSDSVLDLQDQRLGKVKILNVTEARANLATLLTDKEHPYVITRNNKPVRVVVNYDFFLQAQLNQPKNATSNPVSSEPRSHIKGLLADREAALKKPTFSTPAPEPLPQAFVPPTFVPSVKPIKTEFKAQPVVEPEPVFEEETDYFTALESEDLILPEPPVSSETLEIAEVETEEVHSSHGFDSLPPEADRHHVQVMDPAIMSSSKADRQDDVEEETRPLTTEVKKVEHTPEDADYFARFRKLYESAPASQVAPAFTPVVSKPVVSQPAAVIPQAPVVQPSKPAPQPVAPVQTAATAPVSAENKKEPPSLEDLLRELEEEPLS